MLKSGPFDIFHSFTILKSLFVVTILFKQIHSARNTPTFLRCCIIAKLQHFAFLSRECLNSYSVRFSGQY